MAKNREVRASGKFIKVMREFGKGRLKHGGTGKTVTKKSIALAIAYSEAREIYPPFGHASKTFYKFINKHGGKTTILIRRNKKTGKNVINATEKGKLDPKTGFAPVIKTITQIVNEEETKDIEASIKKFNPIIKTF